MVDQSAQPFGGETAQAAPRAHRTPEQALNVSRLIAGFMLMPAVLLTGVSATVTLMISRRHSVQVEFTPTVIVVAGAGIGIALISHLVAQRMGLGFARRWAAAGRSGSDVVLPEQQQSTKAFGLDIGPTTATVGASGLWDQFFSAAVVGSGMAIMAAAECFVASIVSHSFLIMLAGLGVSLVFLALNFPRKAVWDRWADAEGLVLPWAR